MKKVLVTLVAFLALSLMAFGAEDANGTWKASFDTPNGPQENTFVIKVADGKVSGTISSAMMGTQQITDGKVDGDKITFSLTSDFGVISYAGTIKGDDMTLKLTVGDGQFTLDMAAKRAKT